MIIKISLIALAGFQMGLSHDKQSKEVLAVVNDLQDSLELVQYEIAQQTSIVEDFTGDRSNELMLFVQDQSSKKIGVLIWQPATHSYYLLGAGAVYDDALLLDNLNWVKAFEIIQPGSYPSGDKHRKNLELKQTALKISGGSIGNAFIYFNGSGFSYYYQVTPVMRN